MTAPFLPPPDFSGLARLGAAIGQLIDPNRQRRMQVENFLLANPEIGSTFAEAQRKADEEFFSTEEPSKAVGAADVEAPNVLAQFGFKREQTQQVLSGFPRTFEQRVETKVEELGGLDLAAQQFIENLRTNVAESRLGRITADALVSNQVPEKKAVLEAIQADLGRELSEEEQQRLADWQGHLARMRATNPSRYRQLLEATRSPEFAQFLLKSRELDIAERALDLKERALGIDELAAGNEKLFEEMRFRVELEDTLSKRLEELRTALDEGTKQEKLAAIAGVNRATSMLRALAPGEPSFELVPRERLLGLGLRFQPLAPQSLTLTDRFLYETFLDVFAQRSRDDFSSLQQAALQDPASRDFLSRLNTQQRQQFFENARRVHEEARAGGGSLREQVEDEEDVGPGERRARRTVEVERRAASEIEAKRELISSLEIELASLEAAIGSETNKQRQSILKGRLADKKAELNRQRGALRVLERIPSGSRSIR